MFLIFSSICTDSHNQFRLLHYTYSKCNEVALNNGLDFNLDLTATVRGKKREKYVAPIIQGFNQSIFFSACTLTKLL